MLLINLGIFAGVFLGKQTYDKRKRRKLAHAIATTHKTVAPQIITKQETATAINPRKKRSDDLMAVKASAASAAISILGYTFYYPLVFVSVGIVSYTTRPILLAAIRSWRKKRRVNNDSYSALVTLLLLVLSSAFAAAMHNILYYMSRHLIQKSRADTTQLTTQYFQQTPMFVWLAIPGVDKQIPLDEVKQGNRLIINTGTMIPVDGTIVTGSALVDQQAITGETTVVEKTTGDSVLAATLVISGRIIISASHHGKETRIHKLNQLLQQNDNYKTELELKGEAWANKLSLPIIVTTAGLIPVVGSSAALALLFSVPMNTVRSILSAQTSAHLQRMMQHRILIKDGRSLEALKQIDTILFDKTGTLTHTQPEVIQIICCANLQADSLLTLAAASEQHLEHPIAEAIVAHAEQKSLFLPDVTHSQYALGLGLTATIHQQTIHIGSERFIRQILNHEGAFPEPIPHYLQMHQGHSFVFIAVDYTLQGVIELSPRVRDEVPALIHHLQQQNFQQLAIVSGDQQAPVDRLAAQLGFDAAYGGVLPQEKAQLIHDLQTQGRKVCFIGDGLNDALAMKQADVSICLKSASSLTSEVAQIILLDDNLNNLNELFHITQHLHKSLKRSIYFWVGFGAGNAVAIPLFALNPVQASIFYTSAYFSGLKLSDYVPQSHSLTQKDEESAQTNTKKAAN